MDAPTDRRVHARQRGENLSYTDFTLPAWASCACISTWVLADLHVSISTMPTPFYALSCPCDMLRLRFHLPLFDGARRDPDVACVRGKSAAATCRIDADAGRFHVSDTAVVPRRHDPSGFCIIPSLPAFFRMFCFYDTAHA